jgi:hypothetical protein
VSAVSSRETTPARNNSSTSNTFYSRPRVQFAILHGAFQTNEPTQQSFRGWNTSNRTPYRGRSYGAAPYREQHFSYSQNNYGRGRGIYSPSYNGASQNAEQHTLTSNPRNLPPNPCSNCGFYHQHFSQCRARQVTSRGCRQTSHFVRYCRSARTAVNFQ